MPDETGVRSARFRMAKMTPTSLPLFHRLTTAITRVRTDRPVLALTFDDGPDPACTPVLLDLLARFEAKATFFMLGGPARLHPDLVDRVRREQHAIGVHGDDHTPFPALGTLGRQRQLRAARRACGSPRPRLFRPPFGQQDLRTRLELFLRGFSVVCWEVDAEDWQDGEAFSIAHRVASRAGPGSIILFHDRLHHLPAGAVADRSPMLGAVERLLAGWAGRFTCVTVPGLCRMGTPVREPWHCVAGPDFLKGFTAAPAGRDPGNDLR